MKVSLIFPRMKYESGDPPVGLALLGSVLRNNGYSIDLIDSTFNHSMEHVKERLDNYNPDFVAIYSDSLMFDDVKEILSYAREKGKKTLVGGPHPTLRPEAFKGIADYIVKGEAEELIVEIMEGKHQPGIIEGEKPSLEDLPVPAYDLLDMKKYLKLWHLLDSVDPTLKGTSIFSSRGCPWQCTFCQPVLDKIFGKGVRTRSVDSVIKEIKYLKENFGVQAVFFQDDTFTARKQWAIDFAQRLKDENLNILWGINSRIDLLDKEFMQQLYDGGLRVMHIGIESGSQRVSDEIYNKRIKLEKVPPIIADAEKIGIHCLCFFMLGAPGETEEEIQQTIKFATSLDASEITATITTPLPETHMYAALKETTPIDEKGFDYYKNQVFDNENVNFKRLKFLQKKLLFSFYTHPKRWKYVAKHFTSVNGLKKMYLKVTRFM